MSLRKCATPGLSAAPAAKVGAEDRSKPSRAGQVSHRPKVSGFICTVVWATAALFKTAVVRAGYVPPVQSEGVIRRIELAYACVRQMQPRSKPANARAGLFRLRRGNKNRHAVAASRRWARPASCDDAPTFH